MHYVCKQGKMEAEKSFVTIFKHPSLLRFDTYSVRAFLGIYDAYCTEVVERALQLTTYSTLTEIIQPANMRYCGDHEKLDAAIESDFS